MKLAICSCLKPIMLVLASSIALSACGKSPEEHFQQAQELAKKADYKAAVIELKTVLQAQPDNRSARQLLGEVFVSSGAYLDAEKEISRARSLGAPDDQILPTLAKVYVKLGEPQKALDLGIPTAGLSAKSLASYYAIRAEAQLMLGKRAEADESINAGKQADPNQPELLLTEAKMSLMDKQTSQAAQLIDAALKVDPRFIDALYLKAAWLASENKPDDAIKALQEILAIDATQFRADLAIADLKMKAGDLAATDQSIKAAEKSAKNAPAVKYARGILELRQGELEKASASFLDVLRITPNHLPSMLGYAMANYGLGRYEQSINYAGKVLGATPYHPIAARILAGSLIKTGDIEGGINTLLPLLPRYPNDAQLLALAGEAYLRAGKFEKAMDYLDKASELDPKNASYRTRLAAGHLMGGDDERAVADLEAAASLSNKPGNADLALVIVRLKEKDFDKALQAIAVLEKKLPNNPITYNLRAAALLGKQDRRGARKFLEEALAIDPKFFPTTANLVRLDILDNKPDDARKRLEQVLATDKTNVKAMLALAGLAASANHETEYVEWLEKAAKADPKDIQPRVALIQYYLRKKENQKALRLAKEAADANTDNLRVLNILGTTQLATGDRNAAIETFNRLTTKAPQSAEAQLGLALAYSSNGQLEQARSALKKSLAIRPNFAEAQDALLRLELADKRPEAALQIARQIQAQQPRSPFGFEREGDILVSEKRFQQAVKAYRQAMSNGGGADVVIKLHGALFFAGDANAAEQQLNAWLKQNPKDVAVRAYAAQIYMVNNRNRDAIVLYEELLKLAPRNAVALNNLAILYQRVQDSRALATAEQAYGLAPDNPGVQDTLGWILMEQGQLPRATALLAKAAATAPKVAPIRYHYGVALAKQGKNAAARKELEAALRSGQKFPELDNAKILLNKL